MAKKKNSKSSKKFNKVALIALCVAVAIIAIAIAVYAVVSPTPQERVTAGLMKLITTDTLSIESTSINTMGEGGSITTTLKAVTNKQVADANVAIRIESPDQDTFDESVKAVLPEDGDLYVKIDDPKNTLSEGINAMFGLQVAGGSSDQVRDAFAPYIATIADAIGDKWVRVPKDELSISGNSEQVSAGCYVDFVRELNSNNDARTQLMEHFETNNFIRVDDTLDNKGTSAGYRVSVDKSAMDKFLEKAQDNAAFSKIAACDPTFQLLTSTDGQKIDVWVDQFSRSITHIELHSEASAGADSDTKTEVKFGYSGRVTAEKPSASIDISEVMGPLGAPQPEGEVQAPVEAQ